VHEADYPYRVVVALRADDESLLVLASPLAGMDKVAMSSEAKALEHHSEQAWES
jgi:hypothetical protein